MNTRLKKSNDPCLTAWLEHCAFEVRRGDGRHLTHAQGGDAIFATTYDETYCECLVAGCDWSWRQELKS